MNDSLFHDGRSRGWVETNSTYDTAQVCLNGHFISGSFHDHPQFNKPFCENCGAPTIHECPECGAEIRGYYRGHMSGYSGPPAYCFQCGSPFPWTKAGLEAAHELLALKADGLSETEREGLEASLGDLVADSPKTVVAVVRWRKYLAQAGKQTALAFEKILINVVTEAVKRQLFP